MATKLTINEINIRQLITKFVQVYNYALEASAELPLFTSLANLLFVVEKLYLITNAIWLFDAFDNHSFIKSLLCNYPSIVALFLAEGYLIHASIIKHTSFKTCSAYIPVITVIRCKSHAYRKQPILPSPI